MAYHFCEVAAPAQLVGQTLGHYRILEQIGAGGMGVVYRAHDEQLDRDVAIKVLPSGLLADDGVRKRFRKEALSLAKLNHPNIATVFEFGSQDGIDFLVTEYIPGVTLDAKLAAGTLTEQEVARLGTQLAEGLEAAHQQGVVHRDLKPGNVRLTPDGRLKILDFGLARLMPDASEIGLTVTLSQSQEVTGTLPYMAPEQLRGEPLDFRSDIYSSGAVLYEMATGRRPFEDELSALLTDNILHKPPPPPGQFNPALSPRLEGIVLKCLEKELENRYQSAKELGDDLRRLGTSASGTVAARPPSAKKKWKLTLAAFGVAVVIALLFGLGLGSWREWLHRSSSPQISSLAVLPLENLSSDREQEYFVDGMTEALITELAKISSLKVISRTSAMHYKGTHKSLPEIARELNVDAVVEGTVARSGDRVRITAQLILAPGDRHLWGEAYDRDLHDILILQADVARDIVQKIKGKLTPLEQARTAGAAKISPEAHDLYLKGLYQWFKQTPDGYKKSFAYFQQAVESDPSSSVGYQGLAYYYAALGDEGLLPPREAWTKQKAAIQKALELNPTSADIHLGLAAPSLYYDWDWAAAEKEFKRSLEMNPSGAETRREYAVYLRTMGRVDEAIAEGRRSQDLDPLSVSISASLGWNYYYAHRYDEAIQQFRKTLEMDANVLAAHEGLAKCYQRKGMEAEVIAELHVENMLAGNKELAGSLEHSYRQFGYERTMRVLYQLEIEELQRQAKQHYVSPMFFADLYALLEEKDQALAWLEKAYQERSSKLIDLQVDPDFDSLRSDPRFQELVRRVGLPG